MNDTNLFSLLTTQTWQVVVVAVVAWTLSRKFASDRPHLAHALWMLVLLKAITPPIWCSPTSPFSWLASHNPTTSLQSVEQSDFEFPTPSLESNSSRVVQNPTSSPAKKLHQFNRETGTHSSPRWLGIEFWKNSLKEVLIVGWLAGFAVSFLLLLVRYIALLRTIQKSESVVRPDIDELTGKLSRRLGIRRRVRVLILENEIGPVVLGIASPTIVLPALVVRKLNMNEISLLLAHELTHLRRGDLWWAVVQALAKNVLWFHPFVHLAERRATQEAERSCDEDTVAAMNCSPMAYARCLLKVLNHKHQLRSVPALPGVRPVDITLARMERIMKLGQGSPRSVPAIIWLVLLVGCALTLPGAGITRAQEKQATDRTESSKKDSNSQLRQAYFGSEPFQKFQQSMASLTASSKASSRPVVLKTKLYSKLYSLRDSDVEQLDIDWSAYQDWDDDETGLSERLLDVEKEISIVYNNPTKYAILDHEQCANLLSQINQQKHARETPVSDVTVGNEMAFVTTGVESDYEAGVIEFENRPTETRKVLRTFKTGLDLSVKIETKEDGSCSVGSVFMFSGVTNVSKPGEAMKNTGQDSKPEKPRVTHKIAISKIDFLADQKAALLVYDETQSPWLAVYECRPATDVNSDSMTVQASYEADADDLPKYEFVISSNGDATTELGDCRTLDYFGHKLAVTKSVVLSKKDGRTVLIGTDIEWRRKNRIVASARSGQFEFSDDGKSYVISLKGKARCWMGESELVEADEIDTSYNENSVKMDFRGAVQITHAEPIYSGDDYRGPNISADHVWQENGSVLKCSGNVCVVERTIDGRPTTTRAEEVQLVPAKTKTAFGKNVKVEILDHK
ncbi:M56 family metallopeptidase [Mariniblastus fucicola]|uniref:Methicillin resistance mecR1 protein n=1 Tax=Mariniblastus fucicola TaxID=980251 RepID=A0A5B9P1N6_9BACT|nr:M56 family metallopeptidase [Mariniblastus fucicola]QEG20228.1 Methicillin resistance mecR1 protein [Mariniblastus fucicola]